MKLTPRLEKMLAGPSALPPAEEAAVAAIEDELGFDLPTDYRSFLLRSNGFSIDKDPDVPDLRLHEIETIVDTSYGYDVDVRNDQFVLIGNDGGGFAYAIDFRFATLFFVGLSYLEGRRGFVYLGENLDAFIERLVNGTKEKKPRGLPKRKKKRVVARKVDPHRKPDDPGLAFIARGYETITQVKPQYDEKRGRFLLPTNREWRAGFPSVHLLDPDTARIIPFTEIRDLDLPGAFHPTKDVVLIHAFDPGFDNQRSQQAVFDGRWSMRELDLQSGTLGKELAPHSREQPNDLQFSPDGRFVVEVAADVLSTYYGPTLDESEGGICVFDTDCYELAYRFLGGNDTPVIAFSPDGFLVHTHKYHTVDGRNFTYYHNILYRSLQDQGKVVRKITLQTHCDVFDHLAIAPDGDLYGALEKGLACWFCRIHEDGSLTYPIGQRFLSTGNAFELIGNNHVLIGTGAGSLHLFELTTGEEIWGDRDKRGCCDVLCVSTDARWALTCSGDRQNPRLWRLPEV